MEAIAKARFQRYGARKVNQVLEQIRGKSVEKAQSLLPVIPRRATEVVVKTLKSAVSNLQVKAGRKIEPKGMWVRRAWSDQGPMGQMKRVKPAPMGRAMTFKRKVCHLTLVVSDESAGRA
ncbi:MAG: 50S ribosomal protein L22 [Elusimicrobia bacterium GWA2_69_24]|nr:MAG: 50S ribosomal protein L22 [Elusimicrobia bacterium GWA2_69_24]HBL15686.1 50S ribosomal protein L22 [Elusimicrobiota bacterium]